jgi:uncharacterized iron-regulated membrane protein
MRALCGAIITAGAMIGLGLTALGFGIRFQNNPTVHEGGQLFGIPTMVLILIVLLLCVLIGIGIAFLGLMYHHQRRHFELHGERRLGRMESAGPAA